MRKLCFLLGILLLSCATKPKVDTGSPTKTALGATQLVVQPAPKAKLGDAIGLTGIGHNDQGVLSPDGKKLLYVSRGRTLNGTTQIFEMDIASKRERQLTFQDAQVASPVFISAVQIAYCSTTDEDKERLNLTDVISKLGKGTNSSTSTSAGWEIYSRHENSGQITRLTRNPGYDCDLTVVAASKNSKTQLLFVSAKDNKNILATWTDGRVSNFRKQISGVVVRSPALSADENRIAWIQGDSESQQKIFVAGTKNPAGSKNIDADMEIKFPQGQISKLSWHPKRNAIVVAATLKDKPHSGLYLYDLDANCPKTLRNSADGSFFNPFFSPDGINLGFSYRDGSDQQLYLSVFHQPEACDLPVP